MADAVELVTGYISIVPTMAGAQGIITKQLVPAAEKAGADAGGKAGAKFGGGIKVGLAAVAIGGAAIGITKGLYDIGAGFDAMSDTIRTKTGATGKTLDGLVDVAKNVGRNVPAEFEQIGPVVGGLNQRLGLSGKTLQTVASQYLEAGRILEQDVDIKSTTAAFNQFGIEGDSVVGAMDRLFQVSQATGVGMNDLASIAQQNGAAMQNLGFDFDETISLAGALDKAGLNSTQTFSAMGRGLVNLAKDGEEPQEAFRRVTGEIQGLIDKGDTAGAIDLASGIFGTKAANQFVGAVQSGTLELDDLTGALTTSSDTILGVGEDTADFSEKWLMVKNNAKAAIEPLASGVFDALGDALGKAMPFLTGLGNWLSENTWALGVIAGVIGVGLVGAFLAWTASIWASTFALLANPVTWIILGIVAAVALLVGAGILIFKNWDKIVAWFKDLWQGVADFFVGIWRDGIVGPLKSAWQQVTGFFSGLWGWVTGFFSQWGPTILAVIAPFIGIPLLVFQHFDQIKAWLGGIWSSVTSTIQTKLVAPVVGFFTDLWTRAKTVISNGVSGAVSFFTGLPGRAISGLSSLAGRVASFFADTWARGKKAVSDGVTDVVAYFSGLPGKALKALGDLGGKLAEAGMDLIGGFLSGLTKKFEEVKSFIGGIGSWIADHKGPKQYDLNLLVPNGSWIMSGLNAGLERSIPELRATLGRVSSEIQSGVNATTRAAARASEEPFETSPSWPEQVTLVDADGSLLGIMDVKVDTALANDGRAAANGRRRW